MAAIRTLLALLLALPALAADQPNFIVIFADDQGWGDVGVYGSPNIKTPNLDRMAREGVKFTSFYAAPFCGPSRAALMTGCYPPRVSLAFNHGPRSKTGIHPDEVTLAEVLKSAGYATRIIGKWHLGTLPEFRPHRHGFDGWFGMPYSNDMWRYHPVMPPRPNENERMKGARARADYTGYAGQGTYYPPDERRFVTPEMIRGSHLVGSPDEIAERTAQLTRADGEPTDEGRAPRPALALSLVTEEQDLGASIASGSGRAAR